MAQEGDKPKGIPERVHDLYHKFFPGADCPVTGAARDKLFAAARNQEQKSAIDGAGCSSGGVEGGENPEGRRQYKHPHVYDVYGRRIDQEEKPRAAGGVWKMPSFLYYTGLQEINPANRMPKHANQQPAPGQKELLSAYRQRSSIPKGGTDETWVYPSPQMFYNSLVRKNKADDVSERDMDAVVATHNVVNETTWERLLQWERLYAELFPNSSREDPRLLYFKGRPNELSPKAQFKKLLGYGVPFDRHDWTVDRGGREMRYVIDFYYDERAEGMKWPFLIDVRPALDSPAALLLRARMSVDEMLGKSKLAPSLESHRTTSPVQADSQQSPAS
nr:TPA_exp: holocytochrome c synthase [Cheiropleuria bicuspis]